MRTACAFVIATALWVAAQQAWAGNPDWSKVDQALGKSGTNQPESVRRYSLPRTDLHIAVDGTPMEAPQGDPVELANKVRAALAASATPFGSAQPASNGTAAFDTAHLDAIIGYKGKLSGRVYQFAIPRGETITEGGMEVPPAMDTATSINFELLDGARAATAGDLVLLPKEVFDVLRVLRAYDIEIAAIHSHMLDEQPRLVFVHFWAVNDAEKLARDLRAALDMMHLAKTG